MSAVEVIYELWGMLLAVYGGERRGKKKRRRAALVELAKIKLQQIAFFRFLQEPGSHQLTI
jgi:hypothetical protein